MEGMNLEKYILRELEGKLYLDFDELVFSLKNIYSQKSREEIKKELFDELSRNKYLARIDLSDIAASLKIFITTKNNNNRARARLIEIGYRERGPIGSVY